MNFLAKLEIEIMILHTMIIPGGGTSTFSCGSRLALGAFLARAFFDIEPLFASTHISVLNSSRTIIISGSVNFGRRLCGKRSTQDMKSMFRSISAHLCLGCKVATSHLRINSCQQTQESLSP